MYSGSYFLVIAASTIPWVLSHLSLSLSEAYIRGKVAGNGASLYRFYYAIIRAVAFNSEGDERTGDCWIDI